MGIQKRATTRRFERQTFVSLVFLIVLLVSLYGYLVASSVVNAIVRQEIEGNISTVLSSVGELESSYLAQKTVIDEEFVYAHGFHVIAKKEFVTRHSLFGRGLTLGDEN